MAILTWNQLVEKLTPNASHHSSRGWADLVTVSKSVGIGEAISFQKTEYSQQDLDLLSKLTNWWLYLCENGNEEFRDKNTNKNLLYKAAKALKQNEELTIYAVYCPSYKVDTNAYGYTGVVGNHTKKMINAFVDFIYLTNKVGIKVKGIAFFSDLLLENLDKLINTDYLKDLGANYSEFEKLFNDLDKDNLIEVKKLSSISELKTSIGVKGITDGGLGIPPEVYEIVYTRNLVFYKEKLGWGDQRVKERTEILARCYSFMGKIFKNYFLNGIMFWTESAYERARMYNGMDQENPIPIIFPLKE